MPKIDAVKDNENRRDALDDYAPPSEKKVVKAVEDVAPCFTANLQSLNDRCIFEFAQDLVPCCSFEIQEIQEFVRQEEKSSPLAIEVEGDDWTIMSMVADVASNPVETIAKAGMSLIDDYSDMSNDFGCLDSIIKCVNCKVWLGICILAGILIAAGAIIEIKLSPNLMSVPTPDIPFESVFLNSSMPSLSPSAEASPHFTQFQQKNVGSTPSSIQTQLPSQKPIVEQTREAGSEAPTPSMSQPKLSQYFPTKSPVSN